MFVLGIPVVLVIFIWFFVYTFQGQGLDVCRDVPGLLVTVDGKPCNVSVIRENYITCTPPKQVSSAHAGIVVNTLTRTSFYASYTHDHLGPVLLAVD